MTIINSNAFNLLHSWREFSWVRYAYEDGVEIMFDNIKVLSHDFRVDVITCWRNETERDNGLYESEFRIPKNEFSYQYLHNIIRMQIISTILRDENWEEIYHASNEEVDDFLFNQDHICYRVFAKDGEEAILISKFNSLAIAIKNGDRYKIGKCNEDHTCHEIVENLERYLYRK